MNFQVTHHSLIDNVDPRVRLVTALFVSVTVAISTHFLSVGIALLAGLCLVGFARLSLKQVVKRLAELNFFMLFLVVILPLSVAGTPLFHWFFLSYSREGLIKALLIAFKANTIMITITGLAGTMEPATFGKAMHLLGVPTKLVHIFLFMVRYLDLIGDEYKRLRNAMKLRAFQPSSDMHTLRSYGNLIGMVLVRSLERSDAILAAMKCRGFNGRFYAAVTFRFRFVDLWVALLFFCLLVLIIFTEFV